MLAAGRIHPVNGPRYQALKIFLPNHEHDELPCTKWLPSEEHADRMIENRLEFFLVSDNFTNGAVVIWRAHLLGDPVWITIAAVGTPRRGDPRSGPAMGTPRFERNDTIGRHVRARRGRLARGLSGAAEFRR